MTISDMMACGVMQQARKREIQIPESLSVTGYDDVIYSVINHIPELCAWVRANEGITFEDAGKILDAYAYDSWGLSCGRVSLISR